MRDLLIGAMLSMTFLSSCALTTCEEDNGQQMDRSIDVNGFTGVALDLTGSMRIEQGETHQVQLRAGSNILELVKVVVTDGVCHIGSTACYSSNKGVQVVVTMPSLDRVELNGSGDIEIAPGFSMGELMLLIEGSGDLNGTVQCGKLTARIAGSGDMDLKGAAGTFEVDIKGSGDILADELSSGTCIVDIDGSGNARVRASQQLKVSIDGSGDVIYSGDPAKIEQNIDGSGELRKAKSKRAI